MPDALPSTIVIAEIGENHIGDMGLAHELVRRAAAAGADVVKFQSYTPDDADEDDPEREWFERVALSDQAHHDLAALAQQLGVGFLSAPFTLERARFLLDELGLSAVKVASSEMLNRPLLRLLAERCDQVLLSTGLADLEEVREAVALLDEVPDVVVMHCVTQYPLADADANLRAIATLADAFPERRVGYSDHTLGGLAPVVAVALGATVIEKHVTLDRALPGTDHELSLLPEELATVVAEIRRAELLLGRPEKAPVAAELAIRDAVRSRFPKG